MTALDERIALVYELHETGPRGICTACSRPAPCPTRRLLDGACVCPACRTVAPTPHRRSCGVAR